VDIDVARAIEEVLDQRKAVNIQGLGSLMLEDTPAAMSADALKIEPPSTKLRFYETKTKNGPLRKHLMYRYDLNKEAAQKVIKKYSQSIVNTLLNYNEVSIKGVAKIKKVDSGYKLKPKKSFINKYFGGLPVIDLPKPVELAPEKTAIVKPLASKANVSGVAASTDSSISDSTKPKRAPSLSSFAEKVAASNTMQQSEVDKKIGEKTAPKSEAKPTSKSEPAKSELSKSLPKPSKSHISSPSSPATTPSKAELSQKVESTTPSKYIRQPAKHAVTNKPIDNTTPSVSPKIETAAMPKVDKPTLSTSQVTTTKPVAPPKPASVKEEPSTSVTAASPKSPAEKPAGKSTTQDKSISSVSKPAALTLNEKLALAADSSTKKTTQTTPAVVAKTTAEIKEKYNLKTPSTQTGPTTTPPVYQDEGFGCRGPLLGLLAFLLLFFLIYKGCNLISSKSSETSAVTEKEMSDHSASEVGGTITSEDQDSDSGDDSSTGASADRPSSCVIITGVFSRTRNIKKMENLLQSRGYQVYMEDYGPYTRVGLEFDCANADLVDYIQNIRRSIPNAAKAWYLQPELHVDY
jgi:nucleoid DNA-binding protein